MSFNMMSAESYPSMFPFSAAVWHNSTGLPALSYGPVILGHARYLYPLSASAKRQYPRCIGEKRANSFTIDAILGLQEAEARNALVKDELIDAVYDFAPRQQQFSSGGATLSSRRQPTVFSPKLPATHMAFVSGPTYHTPLPEGDLVVRRPRLKGSEETGRGEYDHKDRDEDFKFLGSFGEMDSCRKILNRDEPCNGLKRSAPLGWTDEGLLVEQINKPKRVRTIFTQDQLDRLETEFARQQYMVGTERLYLASQLDLSESQVKVWFQNRRIKWRKQNLEQQQEKLAKYRALRNKERTDRQCEDDPELNDRCKASDVNDEIKDARDEGKSNALTSKHGSKSEEQETPAKQASDRSSCSRYAPSQNHELTA